MFSPCPLRAQWLSSDKGVAVIPDIFIGNLRRTTSTNSTKYDYI